MLVCHTNLVKGRHFGVASELSDLRWRKWGYGANGGRYDYTAPTRHIIGNDFDAKHYRAEG